MIFFSPPIIEEIHDVANKFLFPLNPEETYQRIIAEATRLTGASYGSIFLRKQQHFDRVYSTTPTGLKVEPRKEGRVYQAYTSGKVVFYTAQQRYFFHPESKGETYYECLVPLRNRDKSMGVMTLLFAKNPKTSKSQLLNTMKLFGATASLAIRKSQLHEDLQSAIKGRDLFISIAAHELRTPLTTISSSLRIIQDRIKAGKLPELMLVNLLSDETKRMTRLVNELLMISQIESGRFKYNFKRNNLLEIVRRAMNDLTISYPDRPVQLDRQAAKSNLFVKADSDKLGQVFSNLLNNAHKFSPPKQPILIRITNQQDKIIIDVKDKGTGIPAYALKRIFEGFYKAGDPAKQGLGLGLYVSKRIIDRHRGTISVNSLLKKGTLVTVRLPRL